MAVHFSEIFEYELSKDKIHHNNSQVMHIGGSGWGGGSGVRYSFKIKPIFRLIKMLGYSLNKYQLFIKSKKN